MRKIDKYSFLASSEERKILSDAYEEYRFHINNMVTQLSLVGENSFLSNVYTSIISVLSSTYINLYPPIDLAEGSCFEVKKPEFRKVVEQAVLDMFGIDYDILPKNRIVFGTNKNGNIITNLL